jgi:hypothetical protein
MFNRLSDQYEDWNLQEIRPVFLLGLGLEIVSEFDRFIVKDEANIQ